MANGAVAGNISSSTTGVGVGIDAGVTPSVACGLGQAPVSAKGWVLAMLARKGELRVALVPRRLVGPPRHWSGFASAGSGPRRAFLSVHLARPRKTAPEGEDAG